MKMRLEKRNGFKIQLKKKKKQQASEIRKCGE